MRRILEKKSVEPGEPVRKILFLKLAEQGSTVLAYQAVRQAIDRVGRRNVWFLVFDENREILDLLAVIPAENVLTVKIATLGAMAVGMLRRLREIRAREIDTCIDLEFFARSSAAIAYLTGARRRVGFHAYFGEGPYRGDLMTHRLHYNPHLHVGETFLSLVRALDVPPATLPTLTPPLENCSEMPRFHSRPNDVAEARRLLSEVGVTAGTRLVLLNANAGDLLPLRRWEGGNYVSLAKKLLAAFPEIRIGFTGSPVETARTAELVGLVGDPRCVSLAGRTTLRRLVTIFGLAEVLVTNDSGPAHFAALTGIDVVALFGPETPVLFAGRGPRSHPIWSALSCSPCVSAYNNRQSACRDNACMKAITVDQVFARVSAILCERAIRVSEVHG